MSGKKTREKQRAATRAYKRTLPSGQNCPNCGEPLLYGGGHFAPPSFGEPGFFLCKRQERDRE